MIIITGGSDDLIEVRGDIDEEFSDTDFDRGAYVYVSTGDVIRFSLGEDGWEARVIVDATSPTVSNSAEHGGDDDVIIAGSVSWVVATTVHPARPR